MATDLKDHGMNISISTIATLIPVFAGVWFVMQPLMVAQISTAMAQELEDKIEDKTAPIQSAFRVLLLSDINRLKRNIAKLEHKRDRESESYTESDAVRLADYKIELDAYDEAYDDLKAN